MLNQLNPGIAVEASLHSTCCQRFLSSRRHWQNELFSPVVRSETVRLMFTLDSLEGWYITSLDVWNAFLYGKLNEEIYMEQPEGFKIKGQEHKVLRLHCALYSLKQAALSWWKELAGSMKKLGFKHLASVLSYDLPGSFRNGKYAENNSGQERTKSRTLPVTDKDLASTYVLCCPSPTCP